MPRRRGNSRESTARAAATVGGTSRESIRKFKRIDRERPDLAEQVRLGTLGVCAAYDEVVLETRAPLYVRVPLDLDERLRVEAERCGTTRAQFALAIIAGYLCPEDA